MKVNGDPPANDVTKAEGSVVRGSLCATDSGAHTATTTAVQKASGACAGVIYFDGRGRTASTGDDDHIRDMIEQLLFTNPGERVNRPDFGSGLLQLIFAPNSPELAAALQYTMQAALQRWLSDLIDLQALEVMSQDSTLQVLVQYVVRRTGEQQLAQFVRAVAI